MKKALKTGKEMGENTSLNLDVPTLKKVNLGVYPVKFISRK